MKGIASLYVYGTDERAIQCQMSSTVTEDLDRTDSLKCWEIQNGKRGQLVYEFSDVLYAVSLRVVDSSLLLSEWEAGTATCYQLIDFSSKNPRVILDSDTGLCSKARMEIAYGQKSEVALLLEQFVGGTSRSESKVSCWKAGKLTTDIVPWKKRFDWLQAHCWE